MSRTTNYHRTSSNSTTGTFEGGKFVEGGSASNSNRSLGGDKNTATTDNQHHHHHRNISSTKSYDGHHDDNRDEYDKDEEYANSQGGKNIIRYTREKLLSLRGRVDEDKDGNKVPTVLMELDDDIIVSKVAQDPGKFFLKGRGVVY